MNTELLGLGERLLAGSLNGLLQGLVITLIVAVALRFLRRTNAATRHAIWLCTLVVVVVLLFAHCLGNLITERPTQTMPTALENTSPVSSADAVDNDDDSGL